MDTVWLVWFDSEVYQGSVLVEVCGSEEDAVQRLALAEEEPTYEPWRKGRETAEKRFRIERQKVWKV